MIQEDYVTYVQALEVFALGFCSEDIESYYATTTCYDGYDNPTKYEEGDVVYDPYGLSASEVIGRPSLSLVQKWLREEKGLFIDVHTWHNYPKENETYQFTFECEVFSNKNELIDKWKQYDTYKQALSSGIDKCIELLKQSDLVS